MAKPFLHTASRVRTNLPHTIPPSKPPCQPCSDHQVIFRSNSSLGQASLVSALWSSLPNWVPPSPFIQGLCDKVCLPHLAEQTYAQEPGLGVGVGFTSLSLVPDTWQVLNKYRSNKQTQQFQCQSVTALQNCKCSVSLPPAPPWKLANTKHYHFPQLNSYGKESTSNVEDLGSIPGSGRSLE